MARTLRKRSRSKWARRGYACTDFLAGLAGGLLEHLGTLLGSVLGRALECLKTMRQGIANRPDWLRSKTPGARPPEVLAENTEHVFEPIRTEELGVRFDDIAGLEEAKREVSLRLVLPIRHADLANRYGIRSGGGILLYGPPGTGKTMLAKAVATELAVDFYHISPADLMSSRVGASEKRIANLFRSVRRSERAVLFLDEVDALVPRRRNNGSTIMRRVVSQILSEVDGLASGRPGNGLVLLGATNEIEMLDPAMLRPGRFDARIEIGPPDERARRMLLEKALEGLPLPLGFNIDCVVEQTRDMTGAEIVSFVQRAADEAFVRSIEEGGPQDLRFETKPVAMQNASPL